MAELQPPEGQINGGGGGVATITPAMGSSETVGTKRQRRPSVRLGDIGGDQPYDSHNRRNNKHWKLSIDNHHHRNVKDSSIRTSKTRPLTNFGSSGASGSDPHDTLEADDREREGNLETLAIGSWKAKDSKKRSSMGTKRPRSNWVSSKVDDEADGDDKFRHGEDVDDGYRDFEVENSESLLKEQSPNQSLENLAVDGHGNEREVLYHGSRRPIRARASEARGDNHDGVELSGPSDTDGREWKCGGEDGVRVWLNGLGLGRYAPVFEIHEVDDEVLPLLTLEDLKDMGINAVGSRRKMFCAIQKLGKGFS